MSVGVLCSTEWVPYTQYRPLKRLLGQVRPTSIAVGERTHLYLKMASLIHISAQGAGLSIYNFEKSALRDL